MDRIGQYTGAAERQAALERVIDQFQRNALGLPSELGEPKAFRQWELLGRHHGLPTTILDWTQSIYVAAFFAAIGTTPEHDEPMAIWVFDREYFADVESEPKSLDDIVEIYDDIEDFRFNIRAIEQQAIYMKVHFSESPLPGRLGTRLRKIEIPHSVRDEVLGRVSEMRINHRLLFRDLDGASKTATQNVFGRQL